MQNTSVCQPAKAYIHQVFDEDWMLSRPPDGQERWPRRTEDEKGSSKRMLLTRFITMMFLMVIFK